MKLIAIIVLALCCACEAHWNPFTSPQYNCVTWQSLHPVDTTRSTTIAVSHPDSVCTLRR